MDSILPYLTPTLIIPIAVLTALFCFFGYYWYAMSPRSGTLEWVAEASRPKARFTFSRRRYPMRRKDAIPVLAITAVYAVTAFWSLGSFTNPQSFCQLSRGESAAFSLDQPVSLSRVMYYTGLNTGNYSLSASADGDRWYTLLSYTQDGSTALAWRSEADGTTIPRVLAQENTGEALHQKYSDLFKWIDASFLRTADGSGEVSPASLSFRYFRLTGTPESGKDWLELGELALYDENGDRIDAGRITCEDENAAALFDEGNTVPSAPSWYNSSYFDEIYHPRTAYEHIRGIYPYEISHPPLGKLIMSLGIRMFGLTPFGWRFMGTLFGVGMLPLLYVFLKNLFGKTLVASCGTVLFAFDFMHLTQTRIGTIDTYGVFFILAMYFFMYRYLTLPSGASFRRGALPLFLSGLMWGIGAASKWTVIYGAAGLAILYFLGLFFKWRDWPRDTDAPAFAPWLIKTLLFSVLCFVVIPAVIYTLSYYPYAAAKGDTSLSGLMGAMLDNQKYMFTYHKGVHDPHPYESRWYQWIVNGRPILYYLDSRSGAAQGLKAAFAAFSNPIVCWGGLLALISTAVQAIRRRSGRALFIVVAYFSQLIPWMFIFRTTFEYHYFPSILFLVFALCFVFNDLAERRPAHWKGAVYGVTGAALALYAAFYPVLVGLMVPTWYTTNLLCWIPGAWPF